MTTTATPATSSLDAVLGKIDALLASPVATVEMTQTQLNEHVASELEKAIADAAAGKVDAHKARLEHLKAQVATAKAIFDKGATLAPITMFKDPWQTLPGEGAAKGSVEVPQPAITPTGDSNVQFMQDVIVTTEKGARALSPTFKALFSIAKAAADAPIRKALATKAGEAAPAIIAKAGEALACLEKIATIFGYTPEPGETLLDCDFRWSVEDTVRALQNAARTETVIQQMSGLLGAATAKAAITGAAPAPAAAPAAPSIQAPATPAPAATPASEAWPLDMATAELDEKTGLMKAKGDDGSLYWGRDSEKAPTT